MEIRASSKIPEGCWGPWLLCVMDPYEWQQYGFPVLEGKRNPLCRLINWIVQTCLFWSLKHTPVIQERLKIQKTVDFKICFWGGGKRERKRSLPCTKACKFLDFLSWLSFSYCLHLMPSKLSMEASFSFVLSQQFHDHLLHDSCRNGAIFFGFL